MLGSLAPKSPFGNRRGRPKKGAAPRDPVESDDFGVDDGPDEEVERLARSADDEDTEPELEGFTFDEFDST